MPERLLVVDLPWPLVRLVRALPKALLVDPAAEGPRTQFVPSRNGRKLNLTGQITVLARRCRSWRRSPKQYPIQQVS